MNREMNKMVDLLQKQLKVQKARDKQLEKVVQNHMELIKGDMSKINTKEVAEKVHKMILEIGHTAEKIESVVIIVKTELV